LKLGNSGFLSNIGIWVERIELFLCSYFRYQSAEGSMSLPEFSMMAFEEAKIGPAHPTNHNDLVTAFSIRWKIERQTA
jgi:hypothetical protein